jgi:hypothetical protein
MPTRFSHGHALVIGIANYPLVAKLPETVLKDGRDVAALLRSEDFCGYPSDNIELLLDEQATAEGIRQGLRRLAEATGSEDTAVVFFSGHGGRRESGPDAGTYLSRSTVVRPTPALQFRRSKQRQGRFVSCLGAGCSGVSHAMSALSRAGW